MLPRAHLIKNEPIQYLTCAGLIMKKSEVSLIGRLQHLRQGLQIKIQQHQMQAQSIVYDLYNYSICPQFLDINRYRQTNELNKKGTQFYETLSCQMESYYRLIREVPLKCKGLLQSNLHHERWEIKKFKGFIGDMLQLFSLISEFQIDNFSTVRNSVYEVGDTDVSFYKFINNVEKYAKEQQKLKQSLVLYRKVVQQLKTKGELIFKKVKKPDHYYNLKSITPEVNEVSQKIQQREKLETQITGLAENISENTKTFEKDLLFLRRTFLKNKYSQLSKITHLCKNSKQSLIQIFTYLSQFIQTKHSVFSKPKSQVPDINRFKNVEPSKLTQLIMSQKNTYNTVLNDYIELMNNIINSLTYVGVQSKLMRKKQLELIEALAKYYEYEECDIEEVKSVINLYSNFTRILGELGDKLVFSVNNIVQLQKKVDKCSQMTLTLIRCSPSAKSSKRKSSFSERSQEAGSEYLDILNEEMNPVYILNILSKIVEDLRQTIMRIRDCFLSLEPNRKRKVQNSMQISYITEIKRAVQRKPSRFEHWLWKNCKQEIEKGFAAEQSFDQLFKQLTNLTTQAKQEDKEIEVLNCVLSSRKAQGVLKLQTKSLLFEAHDHTMSLFIPFNDIEKVDMEFNLMSKKLLVETIIGLLSFVDMTNGGIKRFYVNIEKALDSYNEENGVECNKVAISEEQLAFINKRKGDLQKELEPVKDYEHLQRVLFSDTDIEVFYKVVYSGQPINILGKEYANFSAFMTKKYNNFNDKYTEYDKPGPKFYTGKEGVNFLNCPAYSERVIEYDHYLPKMPFVPQSCHNKQTVRVYWVSNQEIHIRETNITTNAPFTENFYMVGLVIVKQIGSDVEVNFYMKLVQIRDFTMKSMAYSTSTSEFKKGVEIFCEQLKRVMSRYKKKGKAGKTEDKELVDDSQASDKTNIRQYKSTIRRLEGKYKQLQYILLAVFVLNIVLYYYS